MDDPELVLQAGAWRARVAPYGASLRGVWFDGESVVTGYQGRENKLGGQGDVLIPFPGRVAGGAYDWNGVRYQMPVNDKDGPNAIHGFLRTRVWNVRVQGDDSVAFSVDFPGADGYPFPLKVQVEYRLDAEGLRCAFAIENAGASAAPVAAGFHPYFCAGSETIDGDALTLPFASVLEFENLVPTGRVLPAAEAGLDFQAARTIGETRFNHCFLHPRRDPDGRVRVRFQGARRLVTVWMDKAFGYAVLYSGDPLPAAHRRRALAIEPMTGGSDAFHHPQWGLRTLAPGETFSGAWGVQVE